MIYEIPNTIKMGTGSQNFLHYGPDVLKLVSMERLYHKKSKFAITFYEGEYCTDLSLYIILFYNPESGTEKLAAVVAMEKGFVAVNLSTNLEKKTGVIYFNY